MPKHLIVGASGQLGTALTTQLGADALPAARRLLQPNWLALDLEKIAADPTLLDPIFAEHQIASVFCAAGATNVDRCETEPAWAEAANHLGPLTLARAARHIPFIFFSTDYVFDGAAGPYTEEAEPKPLSIYGRTKLEGELSILNEHPQAIVIRTTTVYGPDPQAKNFLYTLRRLLSEGKPMRVPTDQLANPTYVDDLATAAIALMQQGRTGLFHAAGPDFLSRYDFALEACNILGLWPATMSPVTTPDLAQPAARPLLGGLVSAKLDEALIPTLGRKPMRPIVQGIRDWADAL